MTWWPLVQLIATPILAAMTTIWIQSRTTREVVSCFVDWEFDYDNERGRIEHPYLGVHNRSTQPIAVHRVQFLRNGLFAQKQIEGTALLFEDPTDLAFPYMVKPGEIRILILDKDAARQVASEVAQPWKTIARIFGRPRVLLEVRTTADTRLVIAAERALPWTERQGRS